jgi:hypothetical protein
MTSFSTMQHRIGWVVAALAASCVQPVLCQSDIPAGTEVSIPRVFAGNPLPKWENGFYVGYETEPQHAPLVYAFDRMGRKLFEVPLAMEGVSRAFVRSMAASRDGRFAFSGTAQSSSGAWAYFIAFLDRAGRITRVNRLSGVTARHLCFGPDGTLWGAVEFVNWIGIPGGGIGPEHDLLRGYTPEGELKFSLLPRSSFAPVVKDWVRYPHPVNEGDFGCSQLTANDGEIVFLSLAFRQLVRVSRDGKVLSRTPVERPTPEDPGTMITGFAVAPAGDIYVSTQEKSPTLQPHSDFVFYRWNAPTGQWRRIYSRSSRETGRPIALEMFEQDRMLVRTGDARYRWVGEVGGTYRLE